MSNLIPDYHLHTSFSGDCDTDPYHLIEEMIRKGMTSACFTDHNDLDYPLPPDGCTFDNPIEVYIPALKEIQEKVASKFDLRIGLEQGVQPHTVENLKNFTKKHPGLDFVICSTHYVEHDDPYYPGFFDGHDPMERYIKYFEEMLYTVKHFTDYNVYGHLDYIFRYGPGIKHKDNFKLSAFPAADLIEEILKTIIANGKGIEINTGALYRGMDYAHPHPETLKLYKDLGGEILTFGSDSHDDIHMGYRFEEAAELAKSMGFKYYSTFKQMKPEFIAL